MAVKSLKELQFPGGADSYTFDATLFGGKTPDLFALLGGNNEFTGSNVFSKRIKVGSWLYNLGSVGSVEYGNMIQFPSKSGWFAYASDEDSANLSLYARYTDLSSYVTNSSLTSTLKSYVTNASLTSTLGSYVTNTSLTTTLGDYVTKTSLSATLGGYAKLSANNAFTGTNSFSNAISVDTINSKSTGNSIARMYYDTDKVYKVLFGSVARQITLLGSADRPYYAKDGEAFNAHSLALSEDLGDYVKRSEFVPPVGTILAFADGTQPASLYANTTWQKIEGRFIIGADSTYKAGTTGGSSSHRHSLQHPESDGVANIGLQPEGRITTSVSPGWGNSGEGGKSIKISGSSVEPADNWGIDYTATLNGSTAYAETVPPYAAYNLWVRTA